MERLRRKEYQSLLRPKKGVNDKSTCNFLAQRNRRRALRQRGKGSIMTAKTAMPKISDIEETPNPNAVKFVLREAVSNGVAQQFVSAAQAANDPLAKALFDVGHVVSVFYMDRMITVEKDDEGDWDELLPTLAVPIRAAESVASATSAAAAVGGAIAAATSDDPRLVRVNELLDEKVRPYLMSDGGYLEILSLNDHTLTIRYQGACGVKSTRVFYGLRRV